MIARDLSAGNADSSGEITADSCGAYAVETLKQAMAAGWKPAPDSNWTKFLPDRQEPCGLPGTDKELDMNVTSSARLRLECLEPRSLLSAIGLPLLPLAAPPSVPRRRASSIAATGIRLPRQPWGTR